MAPGFRIEVESEGRLRASGELDFASAARALRAGLDLLPAGRPCTLDLSGITTADSAGLAVLIEWLSVAGARGGTLAFESVPAQLRAIARISDLEELLVGHSGG
jgi:phospholipid transport system transporter-binding protein